VCREMRAYGSGLMTDRLKYEDISLKGEKFQLVSIYRYFFKKALTYQKQKPENKKWHRETMGI